MLIPYRVKNLPKRFPFATIAIIIINVIVYMCTTNLFVAIRDDVVEHYAFGLGISPLVNYFSAIFLHQNLMHIIGNMLFLWVFGPPVEDRMGIPKYVIMYLATGFIGAFLESLLEVAITGHCRLGIGASGCIMGVVGAYWYLFPRSLVCVFFWLFYYAGVWEVQALVIIGIFFGLDLVEGILSAGTGGVANFAHVGGSIGGALICLLLAIKRDNADVSQAKAIQADMGNLALVPLNALQTMLENDPENMDLVRAIIRPALSARKPEIIDAAMTRIGPKLVERDPSFVSYYLLELRGKVDIYQPAHLIRLAGQMESANDISRALAMYQILLTSYPNDPSTEKALYRMAHISWNSLRNAPNVRNYLRQMAEKFPNGAMTPSGKALWNQVERELAAEK